MKNIAVRATTIAALAFVLCLTLLGAFSVASASSPVTWDGNGDENLPCSGNEHWVLSPAQGITSATLTIDGTNYAMTQNGEGSFSVDTNVGIDGSETVTATYEGENESAFIKLSHCDSGASTTTPPATTTTPPPTTTTPPPTTTTPPPTTSTTTPPGGTTTTTTPPGPPDHPEGFCERHPHAPGCRHTVTPPRGLAFTGSDRIPVIALGIALLLLGTGALWWSRKVGE